MALNSNFVMNRIGFTPCETSGDPATPHGDMDATYTSSRLGLTFVAADKRPARPTERPAPKLSPRSNDKSLNRPPTVSIERPAMNQTPKPRKVRTPLWNRFWSAVSSLVASVMKQTQKPKAGLKAIEQVETPESIPSRPAEAPAHKAARDDSDTIYRKGTYKMPAELITRLKHCSKVSHEYQYRLVIESLDEFLTSK